MIVVRLQGGLGNQMFQYATGLSLAQKHGAVLRLDTGFLLDRTPRENFVFRDFDLKLFGIPEKAASAREIRRFRRVGDPGSRRILERIADRLTRRTFFRETDFDFDERVPGLPDNSYLEGYFQQAAYFSDIEPLVRRRFRLEFTPPPLAEATALLADEIRGSSSICLNVRRGDYVSNPLANAHHGVCPAAYYCRGLERVRASGIEGHVYVFSDDVPWCREQFAGRPGVTVVGHEHAGERFGVYLWLMTLCRHFVIPNSSFGWWAAWLGAYPGKIVVRPATWFRAPEVRRVNICPAEWMAVPNE